MTIAFASPVETAAPELPPDDLALTVPGEAGRRIIEFAVPDAYCAACIATIEGALTARPEVSAARVNLSRRRVRVEFDPEMGSAKGLAAAIAGSGYRCNVLDPADDSGRDPALGELVRSMAVAGFAAANIMLFSVSVWAGADPPTRNLFHWISALIAVPAIAYAGRPFVRSAMAALRAGRSNMDVPITIGIALATGLSLYETAASGEHAYFDASTMLLFFLLAGRTLDHLMREQARGALANLVKLSPRNATEILADGSLRMLPVDQIVAGTPLLLRPGDRAPVDCLVTEGSGSIDQSVVTGESLPVAVGPGSRLAAGSVNDAIALKVTAIGPVGDSFIARMIQLMEGAESARTGYRRIADRAAAVYAPVLHLTAALTLLGWGVTTGDWHRALVYAISVLIITCPCALALAVPIVQTVAAGRLYRQGIMMRDGVALERAASVSVIAFDKTGTLTVGVPMLERQVFGPASMLAVAASIALHSNHPLAQAIVRAQEDAVPLLATARETAGQGIELTRADGAWRLGGGVFCGVSAEEIAATAGARVYLSHNGKLLAAFAFTDALRPDASSAVAALAKAGLATEIVSGDTRAAVVEVADRLHIGRIDSQLSPADKLAHIAELRARGDRVMMVGDGINDAPALRAADVSMAPSDATDIGRSAADFVFTNGRLRSVPVTLRLARRARRLVIENLSIAVIYNALALPLAIAGQVTPLVAAVAMSGSSLLVVANAMRLNFGGRNKLEEAVR